VQLEGSQEVVIGGGRGFTLENIDTSRAVLACRTCSERWMVEDPGEGHLLPRGWWICPHGCNDPQQPTEQELKEAAPSSGAATESCSASACSLTEEGRREFARSLWVPGSSFVVYTGATFEDLQKIASWWEDSARP
jgi:hypothetical protein